jgi:hypothetical protein
MQGSGWLVLTEFVVRVALLVLVDDWNCNVHPHAVLVVLLNDIVGVGSAITVSQNSEKLEGVG